jgi:YHYH protein
MNGSAIARIPKQILSAIPFALRAGSLTVAFYLLFAQLPFGSSARSRAPAARTDVLDIHHLPLGDGKVSASPQRGYVMSCIAQFHGRGAQLAGPWIHGNTWDPTEKISVQGRVLWPEAAFRVTTETNDRIVTRLIHGNGLPVDTPTGTFPVAYDDPAFEIDRNPNSIVAQQIVLTLPFDPRPAAVSSCVPMGMIGVSLNGVAIFNALDDAGRDAVAHEVQDLCNGHPQMEGQYHYHGPSACLPNESANETLIGYAIDGFGIYSMYDLQGREITDADLDDCHGRSSEIDWDGSRVVMYHYVLTREYPYTIGCFRGTPAHVAGRGARGRMGPPPNGMPPGLPTYGLAPRFGPSN